MSARWVAGAIVALLLTACTQSRPTASAFATVTETSVPPTPSTLPVTLYFRSPDASALVPVAMEIPRSGEPAKQALQLLIAGPTDGTIGLPVLPADTTVHEFRMDGDTAVVKITGDVDADAPADDALLHLAGLVNTLTEFPSITSVSLQASGTDSASAYHGWGIPSRLVRDESFLDPPSERDSPPALSSFTSAPKAVSGARPVDTASSTAAAAHLASVRVVDGLAYVRVVLELDVPAGAAMPIARTVSTPGELRLELRGVDHELPILAPDTTTTQVSLQQRGDAALLIVRTGEATPPLFNVLTDTLPARIILDVKK